MDRHGLDARSLQRLLYEQSGLLGVSGISSDMRQLIASVDPRARQAVDLFVLPYNARAGLARGGFGRA
jgi:acetate kinase